MNHVKLVLSFNLWQPLGCRFEVSGVGEGGNHSKTRAAPWQREAQVKRN